MPYFTTMLTSFPGTQTTFTMVFPSVSSFARGNSVTIRSIASLSRSAAIFTRPRTLPLICKTTSIPSRLRPDPSQAVHF